MNDKLPPLFPIQTNSTDNCSKFHSQANSPDFYKEVNQTNGPPPTLPQPLNLPQSPLQSEYSSSLYGNAKHELVQQQQLNNFVEVGSYGRKDWLA